MSSFFIWFFDLFFFQFEIVCKSDFFFHCFVSNTIFCKYVLFQRHFFYSQNSAISKHTFHHPPSPLPSTHLLSHFLFVFEFSFVCDFDLVGVQIKKKKKKPIAINDFTNVFICETRFLVGKIPSKNSKMHIAGSTAPIQIGWRRYMHEIFNYKGYIEWIVFVVGVFVCLS